MLATMRLSRSLLILSGASLCLAQNNRSQVSVGFEFQVEVQDSLRAGSTPDVLSLLDSEILDSLQKKLPQESSSGVPLVRFNKIESKIFSACFTENDECSLVKSTLEVGYEARKPELSVEFETLQLVQEFLQNVTAVDNYFLAKYKFPSMVSSLAQFKMYIVDDRMTDTEIAVLEDTFNEVFGAIIFAIEGDTEVVDAKFLYQDLLNVSDALRGMTTIMSTDLRISGYCRDCTSDDFEKVVVDVIKANTFAFQNKLKVNANARGSSYFDGVSGIAFSVPQLPDPLPPIADPSIFDETPPEVQNRQPWFLWFGMSMAIAFIFCGCYTVFKDNIEYEKEEFSTSDSSEQQDSEYASEADVEEATYEDGED